MLAKKLAGLGAALLLSTAPALAEELVIYHGWSSPASSDRQR